MDTQDDFDLGTATGAEDLQQGQSDATLLKQVRRHTAQTVYYYLP